MVSTFAFGANSPSSSLGFPTKKDVFLIFNHKESMITIQFQSNELLPSLAMVSKVVAQKPTMPILNDVRMETIVDNTCGYMLELMASDGETWLQWRASVIDADASVSLCIDAKSFVQALGNLDGKAVTMQIDDEKHLVTCKYENGKFTLPFVDAIEFPMPNVECNDGKEKLIDSKKMLTAIERASFAVANDELRPVMNGVKFDFLHDGMVTVATDGHKLSKYKDLTILGESEEESNGFIMPKKPCNTLLNVLANTIAGDVHVLFNANVLVVENKQFKMCARLIEGRYPNYDSVIPKDYSHVVNIDKQSFIQALRRVLPMGSATSELVSLTFTLENLTIAAEDFDFSKSAQEKIACDYDGETFAIGFKGSTLLQLLQNVDGNVVKVALVDPTRACVLMEENPNSVYDYTSILMPMLLQ